MMAKKIKFNLILDGNPIRTIEQLQENFSVEDILNYYENGLLLRWLEVRDYPQQYTAVSAINKTADKKTILTKLIDIFGMDEITDSDIEEAAAILSYQEDEKQRNAQYQKNAVSKNQIIKEYHHDFKDLIDHMIANGQNMALLKADASEMEHRFAASFSLCYYQLFLDLCEHAPKAIFAMLTRYFFRKFWLEETSENTAYIKKIRDKINQEFTSSSKITRYLGEDLKTATHKARGEWGSFEEPDTKVMVLYISEQTYVKSADGDSKLLHKSLVTGNFPILNGLKFSGRDSSSKVLYLEV